MRGHPSSVAELGDISPSTTQSAVDRRAFPNGKVSVLAQIPLNRTLPPLPVTKSPSKQTRVERGSDAFWARRENSVDISSNTPSKTFIYLKCISCELNNQGLELEIWEEGDFYVRIDVGFYPDTKPAGKQSFWDSSVAG
ncbi:hypothetical protein B0H17DRAFT_1123506 [Mycena rosella]|uniref:Uncharacterized protein n=1 Tax=Mycena rosella TaxID=1033263 RepID=A0AAD7H2D7_MYCRO|nr:hypothetical protein B0H17DRAFT_1123506 [Mycena rosella]